MNEKYSKNLTDAQLDEIVNKLLREAMPPSETVEQIAESPQLLWKVKSNIAAEKARREKKSGFAWYWLVPAFGALALAFATSWFWLPANRENPSIANVELPEKINIEKPTLSDETARSMPQETVKETLPNKKVGIVTPSKQPSPAFTPTKVLLKSEMKKSAPLKIEKADFRVVKTPKNNVVKTKNNVVKVTEKEEVKTDFIPLSYAANSESGQIVRVKVPRSMMVSLGVAANSEQRQSELVNAELVLGDDGLARAIRFVKE